MRWSVPVALILTCILAVPAQAAPPDAAAGGSASSTGRLPAAHLVAPGMGPAFLAADMAVWLPALFEGDYAAAEAAAAEASVASYTLVPLGDADGGRDDVLLYESFEDEGMPHTRLTALTASGRTIWSLEADDEESAYAIGDVDEDGVVDVVHAIHDMTTKERDDGVTTTVESHIRVLSGRDLATLAQTTTRVVTDTEFQEPDPLGDPAGYLLGQNYGSRHRMEMEFLVDRIGTETPGMDVLRYVFYSESASESTLLLLQRHEFRISLDMGIQRLDADAAPLWSWDGLGDGHLTWLGDARDLDGDGLAELLFVASPGIALVFGTLEEEQQEGGNGHVALVGGATGEALWTRDGGDAPYVHAAFVGRADGKEELVAVAIGHEGSAVELVGMDGEAVAKGEFPDRLARAVALGDADGDGADEFALSLQPARGGMAQIVVTDAGFTPKWRENGHLVGALDLDGDGVREVLLSESGLAALDAGSGQPLWTMHEDDARFGLSFIEDIDRDGGSELVILRAADGTDDAEESAEAEDDAAGGAGGGAEAEEARDGEPGDRPMTVQVLRGRDLEALWAKRVYAPAHYVDATAPIPTVHAFAAGDLTGNGGRDVILNLGTQRPWEKDENGHMRQAEFDGDRLDIAMAVEGASGRTVLRYDAMPLADNLTAVPDVRADVGKAGIQLQSSLDTPAPALALVLAALVLVVVARRR